MEQSMKKAKSIIVKNCSKNANFGSTWSVNVFDSK